MPALKTLPNFSDVLAVVGIGEQVADGQRLELLTLLLHVRAQCVELLLGADLALGAIALQVGAQAGDLRAGGVLGFLDALSHARAQLLLTLGSAALHLDREVFLEHHALLGDHFGDDRVAEGEVGDGLVALRLLDARVEVGSGLAQLGDPVLELLLEARLLCGELDLTLGDACFDLGLLVGAAGAHPLLERDDALVGVRIELGEQLGARLLIDRRDDVVGEVQDLLEVARAHVEQQSHARGDALEVPDVRHRRGELDVTHALATHLRAGHFDAALVADDSLVPIALVLAAMAFPVLGRTENLLAEQTVAFRLQGPVVDGLRLGDLTVRPGQDHLRTGDRQLQRIEVFEFQHVCPNYRLLLSNVVHVVALVALEVDTKIEWDVGDVLLTEEDLVLVVGLDLHAEREAFELLDQHTE